MMMIIMPKEAHLRQPDELMTIRPKRHCEER